MDISAKATDAPAGFAPAKGLPKRTCAWCREPFQPYRTTTVYCSRKCSVKATVHARHEAVLARGDARMGRQPAMGLPPRACPTCHAEFQPYRDNQRACSRPCRERLPDRRAVARTQRRQPEVRERKNAARRVTNNPGRREVNRRQNYKRYGVTIEEYDVLLATQEGACALCATVPDLNGKGPAGRLHIDHDHVTGRVRQLLCTCCNQGIGYLRDDPDLLRRAAEYIELHRAA